MELSATTGNKWQQKTLRFYVHHYFAPSLLAKVSCEFMRSLLSICTIK